MTGKSSTPPADTAGKPGETAEIVAEPAPVTDHLAALEAEPEEIESPSAVRVIDDRIKAFVDRGEKMTREKPRKWFAVSLAENAVKNVVRDAKYHARETGRVFRVKNTGEAGKLVYRVTPKPVRPEDTAPDA